MNTFGSFSLLLCCTFYFALISTYFMRIGDGNGGFFGGVCNHGLHGFNVNQLTVGEMKLETSHFTRFISFSGV